MMKKNYLLMIVALLFFEQVYAESTLDLATKEEKIAELEEGVRTGSSTSMLILGTLYLKGTHGVSRDKEKALKLLTQAANNGDLETQRFLAGIYAFPESVLKQGLIKQDLKEAEKWMRAAAKQGYHAGLAELGTAYSAVNKHKEALKLYRDGAKLGDPTAELLMGKSYEYGVGVNIDNKEAFEWYLKAAKKGNLEAQNNLGGFYNKGKGTARNTKKSVEWYELAASQGHPLAQTNMGLKYATGTAGVEQNFSKSISYLSKAAKQNSIPACDTLRTMQSNNMGNKEEILNALVLCN